MTATRWDSPFSNFLLFICLTLCCCYYFVFAHSVTIIRRNQPLVTLSQRSTSTSFCSIVPYFLPLHFCAAVPQNHSLRNLIRQMFCCFFFSKNLKKETHIAQHGSPAELLYIGWAEEVYLVQIRSLHISLTSVNWSDNSAELYHTNCIKLSDKQLFSPSSPHLLLYLVIDWFQYLLFL